MYINEFNIAKEVAKEVGLFLKIQKVKIIESLHEKDIKLLLDRKAEEIILEKLLKEFNYPILSEEFGLTEVIKNNTPYWIVDPIDGTMNYSRNIPLSCISIALFKNNEAVLGVIYNFNDNELFSAIVSQVAWLNDIKITPSKINQKSESILATGFPVYMNLDNSNLVQFISQIQEYKKIRMIGSAALSLAYVATGRFDTYIEQSIKL